MATPKETPEQREARIQRILRQMEKQLREQLPDPDQTLEQIEQEVVDIGRDLREIIERETLAAAGSGHVGSRAACACGQSARFVTLTARTLVTLNGERRLQRAYYHCPACRQGFCPLDQQWQLGRSEHSVGVRALAARFVAYVSERKAAAELCFVTGIRLSARSGQRAGVAVGSALATEWAEQEARLFTRRAPPPTRRPAPPVARQHGRRDGAGRPGVAGGEGRGGVSARRRRRRDADQLLCDAG